MNTTHRTRPALLRTGLGWRVSALASVLLVVAVIGAGCAGIAAIVGWVAAAGSTVALFQWLDPQTNTSTYTLTGYVYVDSANNSIAVESTPTPPAGGGYIVYASAPMFLDTTPPNLTTSSTLGYFQFTSISEASSTYILTITTPTGTKVQYTVNLTNKTITPMTTSQSVH